MPQVVKEMAAAFPGKPQVISEFGCTGAFQAPGLPMWIASIIQAGASGYLYALLDDNEAFGLYDASYTAKRGQAPVARLMQALADGGTAFTPRPLNVSVSDPNVSSVVIAKSNGSYVHLLWRAWPDGNVHPFTWSYDRPMTVQAEMLASTGGTWIPDAFKWRKGAGQRSDWNNYMDGVIVLELTP